MTFNEGWIEVFSGGAQQALDSARKTLPEFGRLVARAGRGDSWVPFLEKWAKARNADIHYIDNCWLNVAVSAEDLLNFLGDIDQPGNAWVALLVARIDKRDSYIIVAEEF
jgi:hypothetical protein